MFEFTADVHVWLGLAAAGVVALAGVTGLPARPPPDAAALARTVDSVAASPHDALGEHPVAAARWRLSPAGVTLSGPGGRAHASFRYGTVVPVRGEGDLRAVLTGASPADRFGSPRAFAARARAARERAPAWRPAPERVHVRHVTWEGVDVTLVG